MTSATSNAPQIALWAQYVQALGPAAEAFVAAVLATVLQLTQWRTAHDKLRLDLFDRRLRIVNAMSIHIAFGLPNADRLLAMSQAQDGLHGFQYLFPQRRLKLKKSSSCSRK